MLVKISDDENIAQTSKCAYVNPADHTMGVCIGRMQILLMIYLHIQIGLVVQLGFGLTKSAELKNIRSGWIEIGHTEDQEIHNIW